MKVTDWPTSAGLCVAEGAGTTSAGSTVKESAELVTVLLLESVTATFTENGEPVVELGVHVTVALLDEVHPAGNPLHPYVVKEPDPPDGEAVKVTD